MIIYRDMIEEDIPQIIEIEKACFSDPWSADAMRRELHENAHMAHYKVACDGKKVVGYGGYWQVFDEANITNIAVHSDYRRQGIGEGLLKALEAEYPKLGIMYATLEVRVSNEAAKKLYLKNGFVSAGIRPNYYEKPREDADIMWKTMDSLR